MNGLEGWGHLGRVVILDRHGGARRVLRALGELAAAGKVDATIAIHAPEHRSARFVREADEAIALGDSLEEAILRARATTAWLGPASPEERAAFAATCEKVGVAPVGPGAATLRRLIGPRAMLELAAELGAAAEDDEARDASARLVEVVVACDRSGATRVVGAGDASLTLADVAIFAESPAPALGADLEERGVRARRARPRPRSAGAGWAPSGSP